MGGCHSSPREASADGSDDRGPRTWVVGAKDLTLTDAVMSSRAHDRIVLLPGVYNVPDTLTISKPLLILSLASSQATDAHLRRPDDDSPISAAPGTSAGQQEISQQTPQATTGRARSNSLALAPSSLPVSPTEALNTKVTCATSRLVVVDLPDPTLRVVIRGLQLSVESDASPVVFVARGQLCLENCDVRGGQDCAAAQGGASALHARGCSLHHASHAAMSFSGGSRGVVDECRLYSSPTGFIVSSGSNPSVNGCSVFSCGTGLLIRDSGLGSFSSCTVERNSKPGVIVAARGNPILRSCIIRDGESNGIFVRDEGRGVFSDCRICGNGLPGVAACNESSPILTGCKISDGRNAGVLVYDNGRGVIESCSIHDNHMPGIEVRAGGNPVVSACEIFNGESNGVYVHNRGRGVLSTCKIYENVLPGIAIRTAGNPLVHACSVTTGKDNALMVCDRGRGVVTECALHGYSARPLEVRDGCTPLIHECFPETDHQVLTNRGFLSLRELEAAEPEVREARRAASAVLSLVRGTRNSGPVSLLAGSEGDAALRFISELVMADVCSLRIASYVRAEKALRFQLHSRLVVNDACDNPMPMVAFGDRLVHEKWGQETVADQGASANPISLVVTPGHRMYVRLDRKSEAALGGYHLLPASSIVLGESRNLRLLARAENGLALPPFQSPLFVEPFGIATHDKASAFAELAGHVAVRGICEDGAISVTGGNLNSVYSCAERIGLNCTREDRSVRISEPRLVELFARELLRPQQQLPSWVWQFAVPLLRSFLEGAAASCSKEPAPARKESTLIITVGSAQLRDDLVRASLFAGYAPSFWRSGEEREWTISASQSDGAKPLLLNGSQVFMTELPAGVRTWCVTVPSGMIVVRRLAGEHGKILTASRPVIVGNCELHDGKHRHVTEWLQQAPTTLGQEHARILGWCDDQLAKSDQLANDPEDTARRLKDVDAAGGVVAEGDNSEDEEAEGDRHTSTGRRRSVLNPGGVSPDPGEDRDIPRGKDDGNLGSGEGSDREADAVRATQRNLGTPRRRDAVQRQSLPPQHSTPQRAEPAHRNSLAADKLRKQSASFSPSAQHVLAASGNVLA